MSGCGTISISAAPSPPNTKSSRYSRRAWLTALAGAPAVLGAARKPNILFILTDDQRQDTISALGNPHIRTPHLDTLVRSGTVFRNAYCMGGFSPAVCLPSRMMIQRGRAWFSVRRQPPGYPNVAQSLSQAGYVTFHLGKRGNEDTQSHKSYDHNLYVEPDDTADRANGMPGKQVADRTIEFLDRWKQDASRKPFFMYLAFQQSARPADCRTALP